MISCPLLRFSGEKCHHDPKLYSTLDGGIFSLNVLFSILMDINVRNGRCHCGQDSTIISKDFDRPAVTERITAEIAGQSKFYLT